MNAKCCKRIRRALSDLPVAKLEMEIKDGVVLTFKYPEDSYQRVYRDVKRVS